MEAFKLNNMLFKKLKSLHNGNYAMMKNKLVTVRKFYLFPTTQVKQVPIGTLQIARRPNGNICVEIVADSVTSRLVLFPNSEIFQHMGKSVSEMETMIWQSDELIKI